MPRLLSALVSAVVALGLFTLPRVAGAAARTWRVTEARVTFSLNEEHLENLGLSIVEPRREVGPDRSFETGLEPPLRVFTAAPGFALGFRTSEGVFAGFEGGEKALVPVQGGFVFRARHPVTKEALPPVFLFDFTVEIDPGAGRDPVRIRTADPDLPVPLEVRNTGIGVDRERGGLALRMGDLVITEAWAERLGQPHLAGRWIGGFDLRLGIAFPDRREAPVADDTRETAGTIDVRLAELYSLSSLGRIGTFPAGKAGLSAATTSCNVGDTPVPWHAPMAEDHPFIGLALFRKDSTGTLEMIGKSWVKHGFFALANDQCDLGCQGGGGGTLGVGCSDTYSVSNNGSRFYLGPREEIDPHAVTWTACGSFFDGTPVDCNRSYFGNEPNQVNHRLEVYDEDLDVPGASFYYEGAYFVAGDAALANNIGWRACTTTWSGSSWQFQDIVQDPQFPLTPNPGPVVRIWGDQQNQIQVAADDGEVWLAVQVTDLGGGQWHYEYALYNRTSERGVYSFSVPTGGATVTNPGFRDIDKDPATDWTVTVAQGLVTWATDDWISNPDAPALTFQTMFNFRFDADQPPVPALARGRIFKPGVGSEFFVDTQAPAAGATDVLVRGDAGSGLSLRTVRPNPFSESTLLAFSLERERGVRLSVLDVGGRTVRVLLEGTAPGGRSLVRWDGRDASGARVAAGVYFFRLEAGSDVRTIKGTFLH